MTRIPRGLLALTLIAMVAATGCDSVTGGGPKKVVINERVCSSVTFLRMTVGETNRIIVDADEGSEGSLGLSFRMPDFPVQVKGDVPPNSILGDPYSTITLSAVPGESDATVDVVPTMPGNYTAVCGVTTGGRIVAKEIAFQILQN
jgi:hypothetical protein